MIRCNVGVFPTPKGRFSIDDGDGSKNEFAENVNCKRISLDLLISWESH